MACIIDDVKRLYYELLYMYFYNYMDMGVALSMFATEGFI